MTSQPVTDALTMSVWRRGGSRLLCYTMWIAEANTQASHFGGP